LPVTFDEWVSSSSKSTGPTAKNGLGRESPTHSTPSRRPGLATLGRRAVALGEEGTHLDVVVARLVNQGS
jgi:hypothetical protein